MILSEEEIVFRKEQKRLAKIARKKVRRTKKIAANRVIYADRRDRFIVDGTPPVKLHVMPKKDFYSSWEWKKARFEILKKYGPECMLCGSNHRIVVDHIKPRSKFPLLELDQDNLQVLCNDCNMGKSNDDYTDFRPNYSADESDELDIVSTALEHI